MPPAFGDIPLLQPRALGSAGHALRASQAAGAPPARSLYIHIPFCVHKCHYCDFYSFVDAKDQQPAFLDRLLGELDALAPHAAGLPLRTIFVGGGTPSLLRLDLWQRLLDRLACLFDLSLVRAGSDPATEFTVECNPESVTPELASLLRAGGVDRISMGAQSFSPTHLKTLERWHDPASVPRALDILRAAGIPRRSIDLIFAIPGQTEAEWAADLRAALDLGLDHLSCYNLTYEPGTPMTHRLHRGDFEPLPEETEVAMLAAAAAAMARHGLARYEVSNFARPGQESRHNMAYWRCDPWLAAGPSASGHLGGWRWKNVPRLSDYLDSDGYAPAVDIEPPDPARAVRERLMMGLRIAEGLDERALLAQADAASPGAAAALARAFDRLADEGLAERADGRVRLLPAGLLRADALAADLMALVH